jgi:hypothetical protein
MAWGLYLNRTRKSAEPEAQHVKACQPRRRGHNVIARSSISGVFVEAVTPEGHLVIHNLLGFLG